MSTIEVKYNRKISDAQIKRLATSKAEPVNSDSEEYIRVMHKKKAGTGVLRSRKQHGKMTPKRHGVQRYCVVNNKEVMPEYKWKSHISDNFFRERFDKKYFKDGLAGPLGNRYDSIKHYQKTENKW